MNGRLNVDFAKTPSRPRNLEGVCVFGVGAFQKILGIT